MPNTTVRAAAEGMPAINRRRMLLGLAAASTAAAAVTVVPPAHSAVLEENPELIRLAEDLPKAVAAYKAALDAEEWIGAEWKHVWPLAPDCMTLANAVYHPEMDILGNRIIRPGEKNPRELRSLKNLTALVDMKKDGLRRKRTAAARGEVARRLLVAEHDLMAGKAYYAETARLREVSGISAAQATTATALAHVTGAVTAIMDNEATTMAGVIIQAEAMVVWSHHGNLFDRVFNPEKADWGRKFAASVLRLAAGEA